MNRSVLIVDDEPSICKAVQRTLKRHQLTVYKANGGSEALELLKKTRVDCIISDQRMPGMKGTEFLSIAKSKFPDITRIMLSGQSDLQDMEDAINLAGVKQFISKPWNDDHLVASVNEAMTKPPALKVVSTKAAPMQNVPYCPAYIKKHNELEQAIKNDELSLVIDDYLSMKVNQGNLMALRFHWPAEPDLSQEELIAMATEAGFATTLLTWYLLQVVSYSGLTQDNQRLIVDMFDVSALENQSLRKILSLTLHPEQKLLFKISLPAFHQGQHHEQLYPMIQDRLDIYGLMVDMGERTMALDDLNDRSIQCIAMSGMERLINDELTSYKRRSLIEAAANSSIKTILSDGSLRLQRSYASQMKIDFIKAPH